MRRYFGGHHYYRLEAIATMEAIATKSKYFVKRYFGTLRSTRLLCRLFIDGNPCNRTCLSDRGTSAKICKGYQMTHTDIYGYYTVHINFVYMLYHAICV